MKVKGFSLEKPQAKPLLKCLSAPTANAKNKDQSIANWILLPIISYHLLMGKEGTCQYANDSLSRIAALQTNTKVVMNISTGINYIAQNWNN
jgi:hypothetical protein